ncbi:phosphoheptose isomerase [candidate division WOR-1 bacterium RIFOXYD2_FULL_36_8]|uniref:Phosphoheptose isomerase n=1 Tax=candidate division WOR-1 bacterium RIFOXYB2_FULL_36_35 TaxID=1802578 RepID=A0A1F4S4I7_UNCSA|nr:MAG: phosphoheptose isomerase [candidate division WOR-1 bacterium RIFOXYA2_FULL_36_21]OGC14283.1 MAG: phosphoheptose isomerase [candidate division WOR-1 bacterium RIFOXYA12_FULL_36_13]OGC15287.1 MAG: phosphoheptose isomerase [candidate division WOR-1 bacterium RIFOXYB2_FULL_36_35]OGC38950.1 MAG: phosphoheptose isomerase [candidate division WOR-1 bacterium RIFOXYD2_FULL_36_8]
MKLEIEESIEVKKATFEKIIPKIEEAVKLIITAIKTGNKLLICGNGGSASDSQHFAAELISRFKKERRSISAVALTTDTSIITAIGNDYTFDNIFSRQVEGLGQKGDILIGISTSGNSKNILKAIETAKLRELKTIALLGCDGGLIAKKADLSIIVPSNNTPRVQEVHITIIHIICGLVEEEVGK